MRYIRRFWNKFFYEITTKQRVGVIMVFALFLAMTIPMLIFMGFWWTLLSWVASIGGTIYIVIAVNLLQRND